MVGSNMVFGLDLGSFLILATVAGMISYIVGFIMDGVMRRHGFGVIGNMLTLNAGFAIGLSLIQEYGRRGYSMDEKTVLAIGCAFLMLVTMALVKRFALRIE